MSHHGYVWDHGYVRQHVFGVLWFEDRSLLLSAVVQCLRQLRCIRRHLETFHGRQIDKLHSHGKTSFIFEGQLSEIGYFFWRNLDAGKIIPHVILMLLNKLFSLLDY